MDGEFSKALWALAREVTPGSDLWHLLSEVRLGVSLKHSDDLDRRAAEVVAGWAVNKNLALPQGYTPFLEAKAREHDKR